MWYYYYYYYICSGVSILSYLGRIWSTDYLLKAIFSSPDQGIRKSFNIHADITNLALFCFLTTAGTNLTHCRVFEIFTRPRYWLKRRSAVLLLAEK